MSDMLGKANPQAIREFQRKAQAMCNTPSLPHKETQDNTPKQTGLTLKQNEKNDSEKKPLDRQSNQPKLGLLVEEQRLKALAIEYVRDQKRKSQSPSSSSVEKIGLEKKPNDSEDAISQRLFVIFALYLSGILIHMYGCSDC